jgi:PAS domain S-box-containing protein
MLTQAYYSGEWLFRRVDGHEFLAQLTFVRIDVGAKPFILATARDLTLQKAAEENQLQQTADFQQLAQNRHEQFRLSENRYRSLVDASPDAILVVASSGQVELVNPAATVFFGYAASELLAQPIEQFIPTLLAKVQAAFRAQYLPVPTLRPMGQGFLDIDGRRKDGSEFPAEVSLSLIESPDGPQVICVVRHISSTKQAALQMTNLLEQEKNISQMKTRFISLTSHEFRTPMAAAMGSAEILTHHLDQLDQVKRQALLTRITASLQHMNRMLDDILLLNRVDASRVELRLRAVNLAQELQSILHESELGDRGQHTFHFASTTADPAFVSDPGLLQHIFSNLLSNAVRYSPAGTVITLRLNFTVDSAIVEVEDQGIGIPLADQARIFEPFERGSNIGQITGTGLGLNIVHRMVGLLHGTVALSSIGPGGTNFTVVLPRMTAPQP